MLGTIRKGVKTRSVKTRRCRSAPVLNPRRDLPSSLGSSGPIPGESGKGALRCGCGSGSAANSTSPWPGGHSAAKGHLQTQLIPHERLRSSGLRHPRGPQQSLLLAITRVTSTLSLCPPAPLSATWLQSAPRRDFKRKKLFGWLFFKGLPSSHLFFFFIPNYLNTPLSKSLLP